MNKINNKLRYFKSAVAFFFLFLLHGTSIRNGQQGISYNISLNPTKPKWNEHNISKLYFGLAVQRLSLPANYKMQESDKY